MIQKLGKGDEGSLDAAAASRLKRVQITVVSDSFPLQVSIEITHPTQTCVLSNHQDKFRRALIDKAIAKANNERIPCHDFEAWSNEELKEYI